MVPVWVPFKIVSDSPTLHSKWLLLLKIEISSIVHCCFSISQNELKFYNCSYMAMSSLTYSGFFCEICSASLFHLGILWDENHIKIFCSEIWVEMIFGWPTFKIMCNTPIFLSTLDVKLKTRWAITGSWEPLDCNLQSRARTHAVLVIGLYELLDPAT